MSSKPRTEDLEAPSNAVTDAQRDLAVNDNVEASPDASASKWQDKLYRGCWLTAFAVAMIGWTLGLGWAAVSLVKWLF